MTYSDDFIQALIEEKKMLSCKLWPLPKLNPRNGHSLKDIPVTGEAGSEFIIKIRRNDHNPLNFSVILVFLVPNTNSHIRLLRYNGNSHTHSNKIERTVFYNKFHIHRATERYQELGAREDAFAEETDLFSSLESAIRCFVKDCNIIEISNNGQMELW